MSMALRQGFEDLRCKVEIGLASNSRNLDPRNSNYDSCHFLSCLECLIIEDFAMDDYFHMCQFTIELTWRNGFQLIQNV